MATARGCRCLERTLKVTRRELHQAREARREAEAALVMCELQSDGYVCLGGYPWLQSHDIGIFIPLRL